jgi:hypothetical protein
MSRAEDWARGFARQAAVDFRTWEVLRQIEEVPACHPLMFLQMACEKLTKAYLCGTGADLNQIQLSHAYVEKTLPMMIRLQSSLSGLKPSLSASVFHASKRISREIGLLSPAVRDGGRRPDNCEYPWEDLTGKVHVPLDWTFAASQLLYKPAGRTFLKLVGEAIERLVNF